ncbi:hypothetical protein V8E51_008951 [Hyaloscypha variabilis]
MGKTTAPDQSVYSPRPHSTARSRLIYLKPFGKHRQIIVVETIKALVPSFLHHTPRTHHDRSSSGRNEDLPSGQIHQPSSKHRCTLPTGPARGKVRALLALHSQPPALVHPKANPIKHRCTTTTTARRPVFCVLAS